MSEATAATTITERQAHDGQHCASLSGIELGGFLRIPVVFTGPSFPFMSSFADFISSRVDFPSDAMAGNPSAPRSTRTGRRPGPSTTRAEILVAARSGFAEGGYDGTSVRAVAARAGVDPALVHRFFGSKDDLLVAALAMDMEPETRIPELMAGGRSGLGERLVRYFLSVWEESESGQVLVAMLRSASTSERAAALLREFIGSQVLSRIAEALEVEDAQLRVTLMSSQLIGIAMLRYILRYEPLASAPPETIVAAYAPTLQRYLTASLGAAVSETSRRRP